MKPMHLVIAAGILLGIGPNAFAQRGQVIVDAAGLQEPWTVRGRGACFGGWPSR